MNQDEVEATGRGVQYGPQEFFRHPQDVAIAGLDGSLDCERVIVQGLGNVGYHPAKVLSQEDGAKITAIIERDGALVDDNGLDVKAVRNWIAMRGGVKGYADANYAIDSAAVLEKDCDVLVPAALEGVITRQNADRIQEKLIIKAANGTITAGADPPTAAPAGRQSCPAAPQARPGPTSRGRTGALRDGGSISGPTGRRQLLLRDIVA